jgi:hypothetical protein
VGEDIFRIHQRESSRFIVVPHTIHNSITGRLQRRDRQSGFDSAFAEIGVPLGRALGLLRGLCSALIAFLSSSSSAPTHLLEEAREIGAALSNVRFSDIVPRDLEAEEHARQHIGLAAGEDVIDDEGIKERKEMEEMEDMLGRLGVETAVIRRPATADVRALRERLEKLCAEVGLEVEPRST